MMVMLDYGVQMVSYCKYSKYWDQGSHCILKLGVHLDLFLILCTFSV